MNALIWRKRIHGVDGDRAKTDPWDHRLVTVTCLATSNDPSSPDACIQVFDPVLGRFLSKGLNFEQDRDKITLYSHAVWEDKGNLGLHHPQLSQFFSIEGPDPYHRDRVRWGMFPEDSFQEYLAQLNSARQGFQKSRHWAQMGRVVERLQLIEQALARFEKARSK